MRAPPASACCLLLTLLAAGCGSFRDAAPLDDPERAELMTLARELDGVRIRFDGPDSTADFLEESGIRVERAYLATDADHGIDPPYAEVETWPGHVDNLGLTYLTLGLIPMVGDASPGALVRYHSATGRATSAEVRADASFVAGWIGLPIAALPRWSMFFSGIGEIIPDTDAQGQRLALLVAREIAVAAKASRQ